MLSIHQVEAGHHALHAGLHSRTVGREVLVVHAQVAHIYGIVVLAGLYCSVEGIVLQAGQDVGGTLQVALIAAHQSGGDEASQVGVFTVSLGYAAPAGVERDIHHRAVGPADTVGGALLGCDARSALYGFGVPAARLCQGDGEYCVVAVNDIEAEQDGDAQTAFLHCHTLYVAYLVLAHHIEHGTHLAIGHQLTELRLHGAACGGVGAWLQIELPKLLPQCHLLHE